MHDPRALQMGYRILATVREVCSEDTLLHAGENMRNFITFKKNNVALVLWLLYVYAIFA